MTLSQVQVQEIRSMRAEGLAYRKIAKKLGAGIGSVLKYSSDIELSAEQILQLKANEYGAKRIFISNFAKPKEIKAPRLNEDFANLLGHLFFDGHVMHDSGKYVLGYTNSTYAAIENFSQKLETCFALKPSKIFRVNGGKIGWFQLTAYSKNAYLFLKHISPTFSTSKKARIPQILFCANVAVKSAFMRAFWDDEGCISNAGELTGTSKSEEMVDDLVKLHQSLSIQCTKSIAHRKRWGVIYRIRISRNWENYSQFIAFVGFEHANVTRGYNIGKAKKAVLLEKFNQLYGNSAIN